MSEFTESITPENPSLKVGEVLKNERESKDLTIEAIASRLRISQKQVLAMEANDFDVLGEPMIIRGFLRNYAKLLEIDAEPLIEQFKSINPNISPKPLTLSSANIPISSNQNTDWQKYLGISVFIALIVLSWLFYSDYQAKHLDTLNSDTVNKVKSTISPVVDNVVNSINQVQITTPVTESSPVPSQPVIPQSANTQPNVTAPAEVLAESGPSPAVNLSEVSKMRFKARESSWVHVLDANNKVILDAIVPARGEAFAEGKPPFNVVIGNAPVSTLEFNQHVIDLTPFTKGKVARLKLE